jgi:hypothetical protein
MKARSGEAIVCDCPEPAGKLCRNVNDNEIISSYDFVISNYTLSDDGYVCPVCKVQVASLSAGRWQVRTKKGLLG